MKLFKILFVALFFCASVSAQRTVSGTVTDENNSPIPVVSILEKGTTNGIETDFDGKYSLTVADNATLIFRYLGYKTVERKITIQNTVDVKLEQDNTQLDEIVVIGYGSIKRDKVTSSIATVKGEEFVKQIASNPAEALQGRAAGVQVLSGGGNPGASPQILIRGITTAQGSAPLIVLDGVMLPNGTSLNFLNPADIESFQILKDASAGAIYGSRASNGVVIVTTKRGKEGKMNINVDFSTGIQRLERIEVADASEYAAFMQLRRENSGLPADPRFDLATNGNTTNTDWWDETIENYAPLTNANINVMGGSEKFKYAGSISLFDQNSNYTKGWYKKITGRFNMDIKISDKINLKTDLSPRIERFENTPGLLFNTLRIDPLTEVYIPQNQRVGRNIFSIYTHGGNNVPNPVAVAARQFNETEFFGFFSNTQLDYKFLPNFTFRSQLGLNISNDRTDSFAPQFFINGNQQREINSVFRRSRENLDYVFNNTITYENTFVEKHYVNILGGVTYDAQNFNYLQATREGVPDNENPNLRYLDGAEGDITSAAGNEAQDNIFSLLFRTVYSYDNKYIFKGSVRADESSRFAEGRRSGVFSGVSFAWDIDSEDFFESELINNLRFKISAAEVGNQNISRNGQFFGVGTTDFVFGGQRVVGNFLSIFGNPDLRWETVRDENIGIEMAMFNNKLNFSFELYRKTSEDLLFNVEVPSFTGIPGRVAQNVGSFESRGFDAQVGYNNNWGDFTLGLNLTISSNESIAADLAPGNERIIAQNRPEFGGGIKITELGQPVGLFYGYKTLGIFQNQTDINSHSTANGTIIQPNAQPGDLIFQDLNGDGTIGFEDQQAIGNPYADFFGGLTIDMSYKKFDLSMQWYGTYGNEVYNFQNIFLYSGGQDVNVAAGAINQVWSPSNPGARFPRPAVVDQNFNYLRSSDIFIEDGSYLRLRNIQLGYNLDIKGFNKFRVFVSGQNLLTFTNYTGFDPEVAAGGGVIDGFGVDFARNPVARTFLLGLNLQL